MTELLDHSTYVRRAPLEKGAYKDSPPYEVDCLTLIYFMFYKNDIDIPLTFIGNMPDQLNKLADWNVHEIQLSDLKDGDVVFTRKKSEHEALITHTAIFIGGMFLHTTKYFKNAVLQTPKGLFNFYEQPRHDIALRYIDDRDTEARKLAKGKFRSASTSTLQTVDPRSGATVYSPLDSGFHTPNAKHKERSRSAPPPQITDMRAAKLRRIASDDGPSKMITPLPERLNAKDPPIHFDPISKKA